MAKKKPPVKFPLRLHATGQWCKKRRGKSYYFGTDRDAALKRFVAEWPDILAGRSVKPVAVGTTVAELVNHFLTAKRSRVQAGELSPRMWSDYHNTCELAVKAFGGTRPVADLRPDDFAELRTAASKRLGPVALGTLIQRVKTIFKHGFDAELIAVPVRFGTGFDKPPKRVVRLQRADNGPKLIGPADLRAMVDAAGSPLDAMILLGLNGGFGASDCSALPRTALDRPGWIDFRRPKTGSPRRFPLWPETQAALEVVLKDRPDPIDPADSGLVFLTRFGRAFVRFTDPSGGKHGHRSDGIAQEFARLAKRLNIDVQGSFYTLRHVFRTIADGTLDPVAAGLIMGHSDSSIAGAYRERIDDARLLKVTNYVRAWLFGGEHIAP